MNSSTAREPREFCRFPVADRNDVLAAGDAVRAGQFQHQSLVEPADRCELEAVETLDRRDPAYLRNSLKLWIVWRKEVNSNW